MPPRVSVVINTWNGSRFIREAIESVLGQSYLDFETVVYDDASTDCCRDVVGEFQDPRIRLVASREHVPLGMARHLAVQECQGEWIAWLDQDDTWLPWKLERQMDLADRTGGEALGIVYGRTVRFYPDGLQREYDLRFRGRKLPEGDVFLPLLEWGNFIVMSSAMVRRRAYDGIGARLRGIEAAVDYWMFTEISRRWRAAAIDEVCCRYRIHEGNMTWSHGARAYTEVLDLLECWKAEMPPDLYRRRVAVWNTILGVEEMLTPGSRLAGLGRIARRGSFPYLLTRPFVRAARNWKHPRMPPDSSPQKPPALRDPEVR